MLFKTKQLYKHQFLTSYSIFVNFFIFCKGMTEKIKEFTESKRKQKENSNASTLLEYLKSSSEKSGNISLNVSDKYKKV